MSVRRAYRALATAGVALGLAVQVWAFPDAARQTESTCAACHTIVAGGPELNEAGQAFKTSKKAPATKGAGAAGYVGSQRCAACHPAEHKAWSETKHARSLGVLEAATPAQIAQFSKALGVKLKDAPAKSDVCVTCHVTGHKLLGGYPAPDSAKNVALAAVGCESCHGPGSKHLIAPAAQKKATIHGAVSEKTCTTCHIRATSPKFAFAEYRKTGVHALPDSAGK